MDIFLETLILLVLITIQSIFGIGLLLFEKPTFLILGYDFFNTLNFLLPISITVSLLQFISLEAKFKKIVFHFNFYCLPFLVLFLIIALNFKEVLTVKSYVTIVLTISSILALKNNRLLFKEKNNIKI